MTRKEYFRALALRSATLQFPAYQVATSGFLHNTCKYRIKNGRQCAVGILIPPKKYHPDCENRSLRFLRENDFFQIPEGLTLDHMNQIQIIHDTLARNPWSHEKYVARMTAAFPDFLNAIEGGSWKL